MIPPAALLLFTVLHFISVLPSAEQVVYDAFLHLSPGPQESEKILLLNIDDLAIAQVGMFPWSRSIMADGLILLREMEAYMAVFDIEYTEESPMGLDNTFLRTEIPAALDQEFARINSNLFDLITALQDGYIGLGDVQDYASQLAQLNLAGKQDLADRINTVARDNDAYFGQAARYFGNAVFTINLLEQAENEYDAENKEWVAAHFAIPLQVDDDAVIRRAADIRPAIAPILQGGNAAGFTNVHIDSDGVRRRISLVAENDGVYYPQLSFAAVYDLLGKPELHLARGELQMIGARFPDGSERDVSIPIDERGHFAINWPRKQFEESFRSMSYYQLVRHDEMVADIVHNLGIMQEAGYLNYYQGGTPLLQIYEYARSLQSEMLSSGDTSRMEEYRQVRDYFFAETSAFLNGPVRDQLLEQIDDLLSSEQLDEAGQAEYQAIRVSVDETFTKTAGLVNDLQELREHLAAELAGSLCYIGWTGTATTDLGVNPFDSAYDNVGTHASVANTILQRDFIKMESFWISFVLAAVLLFLYYHLQVRLSPGRAVLSGIGFTVLAAVSGWLVFFLFQLYVPMMVPLLSLVVSFIALTAISFLRTSREKTFIRGAFGQYLSNDVIEDLLANPDKLTLGGEKRRLTAIFTDVKGFSTISESMDPGDLVRLLNMYLTLMSDTIMDQRGTIDKFEGDAIIAFFGAPTFFDDHPYRACMSAVLMKRAERERNRKIREEGIGKYMLETRIGINTGDMVVGNMGTARKMDYTIMGNAVNLAARLEGVNKRYGTWILISEAVQESLGGDFAVRRLDRVRVVGLQTPVRLFELLELSSEISAEKRELLDLFDQGLELSEERRWADAVEVFSKVLKIDSEDGPAQFFLKRCQGFMKRPPKDDWDGVFTLTEK